MKYPLSIIINENFEVHTPRSLETGEAEEAGFSREEEAFEVDELRDLIEREDFIHLSNEPPCSTCDWITSEPTQDRAFFEKGREVRKSLHLVDIQDGDGVSLDDDQQLEVWTGLLSRTLTCDPSSAEGRYGDQIRAVQSAMVQALRFAETLADLLPAQGPVNDAHPISLLKRELMSAEGTINGLGAEELIPDPDQPAIGQVVELDAPLRALAKEIQSLKIRYPDLAKNEDRLDR